MEGLLPYIYVDEEQDFNLALIILIVSNLSNIGRKKKPLSFDKLQVAIYLIKNPSKINSFLEALGRDFVAINESHVYTIDSLSVNVDILFDRAKIRYLIKALVSRGILTAEIGDDGSAQYSLTNQGQEIPGSLGSEYFAEISNLILALGPINSASTTKILSTLNVVFKGGV